MKPAVPKPHSPLASEIMTLPQVAEYLHCHPSTLYRLLRRRKFPGFHLGGDWRFRRADIDAWIAAQQMKMPSEEAKADRKQSAQQPARRRESPSGAGS
jgi:excisionase family DNA binding protein